MDKKEFAEIMVDLANAFLERQLVDKSVLETWYKYFQGFSAEDFRATVDRYVLNETKRPSLSELRESTRAHKLRRERDMGLI